MNKLSNCIQPCFVCPQNPQSTGPKSRAHRSWDKHSIHKRQCWLSLHSVNAAETIKGKLDMAVYAEEHFTHLPMLDTKPGNKRSHLILDTKSQVQTGNTSQGHSSGLITFYQRMHRVVIITYLFQAKQCKWHKLT